MLVPSIPVMAVHFGITPGTAAQIITALAFGRLAGMPISGVVLDRLGTRAALVAGPALGCAVAIVAAIMPWFSIILLLIFVLGIAESVWVMAREVAGIDLARPNQRGRVLSGFHGVNYMGLALGPLAGRCPGGSHRVSRSIRRLCSVRGNLGASRFHGGEFSDTAQLSSLAESVRLEHNCLDAALAQSERSRSSN